MSEATIDATNVFGPLSDFIDDPTVEEIWINSPERIFIARNGRSELTMLLLSAEQVRNLVERLLLWSGRRLDLSVPFVDARLPDGSRLHVAIPEITAANWAVNIRKHLMQKVSIAQLAERGVMTAEMAELLRRAVAAGLNILVSGGTQAGKTTMLNALVSTIPVSERVITIEEVFELAPQLPDVIAMQTRSSNLQGEGEISLRRLIKESLRMRPSRIIVGEVRESEALDLLIALNSGLPGMGTLHANSARDAVAKLQILPLLAGENISHRFIAPTIASAIDLIVHVSLDRNGVRRVSEIAVVTGRIEGLTPEVDSLFSWNTETSSYVRGLGSLPHPERFARLDSELIKR
jgi:pilus assembly protein CpaF